MSSPSSPIKHSRPSSSALVRAGLRYAQWIRWLLAVTVLFSALLLVIKFNPPRIHYSLVKPGVAPVPLTIAHTPVFSLGKVQSWTGRAVNNIFTFGFLNADDHFSAMRPYFNRTAWASFSASINSTKLVHKVKASSLLVQITPLATPYVAQAPYKVADQWVWPRIEVPVMISYIGALNSPSVPSQKVTFILSVLEVSPTESPDGLQIASLVPTSYNGP